MGMDVYGRAPTSEVGKYFRRSVWGWHPLASLCVALAPDVCDRCEHWHSNDGDGLDGRGAVKLATVLENKLADGSIATYIAMRNAALTSLPDEPCELCQGTGTRTVPVPLDPKWKPTEGQCNGCGGKGRIRPFETHYGVDVEDVKEFIAFLRDSGGFHIS